MTAIRILLRRPTAVLALVMLCLVALVAAFGGLLAPQDPLTQDTSNTLAGPSSAHWLGSDYLGRDILSRLLEGTQLSVLAALEAVLIALLLGSVAAVVAVFAVPGVRWVIERIFDSFMALPFITFAVAIGALLGNSIHAAMAAVGILAAPTYFRVVRAAVLETAHSQFVEAARLFGVPTPRIILTHVVPRIVPVLLVTSASVLASCLLVVASLTFLGVGVQPPAPTWGGMLSADLNYLSIRPFNPVAPALAIMLTVGALGILADHIRDLPAREDGTELENQYSETEPGSEPPTQGAESATEAAASPPDGSTDLVTIENLHLEADSGAELVRGVNLRVPRGASVGILGESGSGKTMTCRALLGVLPTGVKTTQGKITVDGHELLSGSSGDPWSELYGNEIGAVFQDPATWFTPHLTVGAQTDEALRIILHLNRKEAAKKRNELFAQVGLRDPDRVAGQYIHELSGGMLQRVLLAIAVSGEPNLLIADEPTTALDVTVQAEVLTLIQGLRRAHSLTVLMISHDLAVLAQSCEYLYVFRHGLVVEHGPTEQILQQPSHPYTQALLADHSFFRLETSADRPKKFEADSAETTNHRILERRPT
jgi:peptide/nickel transport system permease protein